MQMVPLAMSLARYTVLTKITNLFAFTSSLLLSKLRFQKKSTSGNRSLGTILGHISGSQNFFAMELFDVIGNITEPSYKLILNTIKEMFYLTKLMS